MKDKKLRLELIAGIIARVDFRCQAADGDVTPTNEEITLAEIQDIYDIAIGNVSAIQYVNGERSPHRAIIGSADEFQIRYEHTTRARRT